MLQLQRASAGSGKTYMLAKKFIEYFISAKDEGSGGKPRLRTERELRDALPQILAITFTNKATNEMKLRIVEKLDSLGKWTPGTPIGKVDYLKEFTELFQCTPEKIADISGKALKILLTDYGDFKVSTIDSFFQTVLRTFAYEADLDDTYQVEIDSNYITQMGLDTTLDDIDTSDPASQGTIWVRNLMVEKADSGKGWNIFQKQTSDKSIYGQILKASRNLDKEDFKEIREDLDRYFEAHPDFFHTFHQLKEVYEKTLRATHSKMRRAAREVRDAFRDAGLDMKQYAGQYLAGRVMNMAENWDWDFSTEKDIKFRIPEFTRAGTQTRVFDPKKKDNPHLNTPVEDRIEELVVKMYACFEEWREETRSERMTRWRIYRQTIPYVGLLQSVRNNARLFLTDSNTVELGETNSILHRIIGDDDAPFVYERLGSRLEHFLIDEFQDTSRLQWANLKPLLSESEGKGNDNLIIGDAKQSIYRFRNADPSLITTRVPKEFSATVRECGTTPAENTNWRSSRKIVEFNNLFFRYFTRDLGEEMDALYSNIVQPPHHTDDKGFVSVQLFRKDKDEDIPAHFLRIPELISDMISRGYRMKDIAVLVDTREQGAMIIDSIMAYNNTRDPEDRIEFISADSLKIGESQSVRSVISILEAINNGTRAELRPKEERKKKGVGDWSRLRADFSFFAMKHPDIPLSEQLTRFLEGEYDPDAIRDMLGEMSTTVLPALVENIIRNFIPAHNRDVEAPFLAALQDNVLDFCDSHSSDIASFLQWWDKKGQYSSISSPEDVDAVQVMTVHKSKGLEFRCVIVPFSKQTIEPLSNHEKEWLWVRPDLSEAAGIPTIPHIPVWSGKDMLNTPHADIYRNYLHQYMTDKVNMAYVAYTRAVDELYIFTPAKFNKDDSLATDTGRIGEYLWKCAVEADTIIPSIVSDYPEAEPYIADAEEFLVDEDELRWTYGKLPTKEEVEAATSARQKKEDNEGSIPITGYRCGNKIPVLLYNDPTAPSQSILPDQDSEELVEPVVTEESRRHGELMHAIMERIETENDVPGALMKMKTRGLISSNQMESLRKELTEAMESVADYGWFAPGQRIINERGIVVRGKVIRPDRIILRPDRSAAIVDYKFGEHRNDKSYLRQVRRYCEALVKSGLAHSCDGYVWYVERREVLRVKGEE